MWLVSPGYFFLPHVALICWVLVLVESVCGLTPSNSHCCVVVGKIIVDTYKNPDKAHEEAVLTVGGGGPQAAWGAAAALAALDKWEIGNPGDSLTDNEPFTGVPPFQPVVFIGPVGQISDHERDSLYSLLKPAVENICLLEAPEFQTPGIQLWHDENQDLKWFPLQDSWGIKGADSLWRNRPSAEDVMKAARGVATRGQSTSNRAIIDSLFLIMEAGRDAPGGGEDSSFLADEALCQSTRVIGVEPVAFPDKTGRVPVCDVEAFKTRLSMYGSIDLIAPDKFLFEATDANTWKEYNVAVRFGDKGSRLSPNGSEEWIDLPVATLRTATGDVVNPTGAGNAYSAAVTACLGKGLSLVEAACVATAVGAAMCEHNHLPPWSWETIRRIRDGASEVKRNC